MNDFDYVRKCFRYDPDTGLFKRVIKYRSNGTFVECDSVPMSITRYGYRQVSFRGCPTTVHRLIWLYMTGDFPQIDIDHINGDRLDNRWINLREVSRQDNLRNQGIRTDNTTGVTGVSYANDRSKYHIYIWLSGKRLNLGYSDDKFEAICIRKSAEITYDFHENHGGRLAWAS